MTDPRGNGSGIDQQDLRATEAQIARTRERLAASVGALREELTGLTDWRSWVKRRPLTFVGAAFGVGLLLGLRR